MTYAIDENGLLKVTATSTSDSNIVENLTVFQDKLNLSDDEITRSVRNAEEERAAATEKRATAKAEHRVIS